MNWNFSIYTSFTYHSENWFYMGIMNFNSRKFYRFVFLTFPGFLLYCSCFNLLFFIIAWKRRTFRSLCVKFCSTFRFFKRRDISLNTAWVNISNLILGYSFEQRYVFIVYWISYITHIFSVFFHILGANQSTYKTLQFYEPFGCGNMVICSRRLHFGFFHIICYG